MARPLIDLKKIVITLTGRAREERKRRGGQERETPTRGSEEGTRGTLAEAERRTGEYCYTKFVLSFYNETGFLIGG